MSRFVSILAGGSGTRLWPLSRSHRPKQLLALIGERSLIQATVDRVRPLVPPERILIITEASHADALREQVPEIPAANVIVEPARRGTAAAVGLAATIIGQRDPDATMASLHSDAAVLDPEEFRRSLAAAYAVAESDDWLVTLGIKPASPHTGMGYIQVGELLGTFEGKLVHRVVRFVEKPDRETAARFVEQGYVWNPGMFIWRTRVILEQFQRLLPDIHSPLQAIGARVDAPDFESMLAAHYPEIPVETIDYGIMERASQIATIPSDFGWSDVGSWGELLNIAPTDGNGNVVRGSHLGIDTARTLIHAEGGRPVFTLGVEDLVVVDLPDALLICRRDRAEEVRRLVDRLPEREDWKKLL